MIRRLLAIFALSLVPLAARADEPVAAVPYRLDYGGWFTVKATVNGQGPYDFIIDSGATQSLAFENLDAIYRFRPSGGPPKEVLGLLARGKFPTFVVGDVALGPARLNDLVTVVLPDWTVAEREPQGVLGLDFLSRYRCVFDADRLELRLYQPGADIGAAQRWNEVKLDRDDFGRDAGAVYLVRAKFSGRAVPLLLDLGASGTVINSPAWGSIPRAIAVRAGMSYGEFVGRIKDALEEKAAARLARIRRIQVGRTSWYRQTVVVYDAPIFDDLGVATTPFGLLGADLLQDRSFVLDFARGELLIGPKRPGGGR